MNSTEVSARRAATQQRIVAAALELFAFRGVHGSSVEQICERAGFTRGAFYSNFDTKDELYIAAVHEQAAQSLERATQALALVNPSAAHPFNDGARNMLESLSEQNLLAGYALRLYAAREPQVRAAYQHEQREWLGRLVEPFDQALESIGRRPRGSSLELLEMLLSLLEHISMEALLNGETEVTDAMVDRVVLSALSLTQTV